jgi:hypothetical protein
MKKLLLSALVILSAFAVKAQGPGGGQRLPPADRAKAFFTNERYAAFAFTEDQKAKITPMLVKFYTSSDSLMATVPQGGGMEAFQAIAPKRTALGEPVEKAIVAMLTPDQKKAYDAALAAAKERNPNATAVFTGGFGGRPRN